MPREDRFKQLLEAAPDAMVIVDSAGNIKLANTQTERLFGYAREEMLGEPVEMFVPERFREKHPAFREAYVREPRVRPMGSGTELFGLRKNGTEFPVEISLSPWPHDDGLWVISSIRDITERKKAEDKVRALLESTRRAELTLQEKNAELERASRVKDNFLATMSHELRTPLNAILGFAGTLLMGLPGPLNADQTEQLQTIENSATHLLSLINDLLDLAKIESGKVVLHRGPVVCQSVIQEVWTTLRPAATAKGLPLDVVAPRNEIVLRTDRRALTQILLNLTNNAIKFTDAGQVRIELTQEAGVTTIRVIDTGIGIRPEDQGRLFQAFEQLDRHVRGTQGTGLGLHLSRKLADLLGGQITLESEVGKGSTFTLTLKG
jgi:protein-histidine pros-kinase